MDTVNVIRLSANRQKLMFINWNGGDPNDYTEIEYNGETYQVVEYGLPGNDWLIIDAPANFTSLGRIVLGGSDPVPTPLEPSLGYGLLYNWYAATDARGVAPSGFRVPTEVELSQLHTSASLFSPNYKSTRVLSDGDPYWSETPFLIANNSLDFGLIGAGSRTSSGSYSVFREHAIVLSQTEAATNARFDIIENDSTGIYFLSQPKTQGATIRCVSDTEPSTTLVQDNDGNSYSWVQIGSQYWLQQSLKTTTYNNGDSIPTGLDNTAWSNTTDGAWAYVNGDANLPI